MSAAKNVRWGSLALFALAGVLALIGEVTGAGFVAVVAGLIEIQA